MNEPSASGYYDYGPLIDLDRHLVVTGYLADETRTIGYQLASLTGLPVTDLDRRIEHHAGKSIWELIWSEGEESYRRFERELLAVALRDRPWGIVSLGDGTLIDKSSCEQVLAEARLVVLDLDLPNCYWRLKAGKAAGQEDWHPLYPGPLERFEQLRTFHGLRAPGFARAHHRIEMRGQSRSDLVDRLLELVPRLSGGPSCSAAGAAIREES